MSVPRILKFEVQPAETGTVIGKGLNVTPLSIGWQGDTLVLWAEVSEPYTDLMPKPAGILALPTPTGADVPTSGFRYLGTAQGGPAGIVMHVYWMQLRSR